MTTDDEARAWFRADPERIKEIRGGDNLFMVTAAQRHATVIVRAALARDTGYCEHCSGSGEIDDEVMEDDDSYDDDPYDTESHLNAGVDD